MKDISWYLLMSNNFWWRKRCSPSEWDDSRWRAQFPAKWRAQTMGSKIFSAGKAKKFTGQKHMGALLCSPKPDHCSEGQMLTIGRYMDSWANIASHKYDFLGYGWNAIHKPSSMRQSVGELAIHCHSSNSSLGTTPGETWDLLQDLLVVRMLNPMITR